MTGRLLCGKACVMEVSLSATFCEGLMLSVPDPAMSMVGLLRGVFKVKVCLGRFVLELV